MADAVAPVTGDPSSNAEVDKAEARVGQPLNAKWTLESLLGVGGMGAVYAAKHRNGSRAAVKLQVTWTSVQTCPEGGVTRLGASCWTMLPMPSCPT